KYPRPKRPLCNWRNSQPPRDGRIPAPSDWLHSKAQQNCSRRPELRNYRSRNRIRSDSKQSDRATASPPRDALPAPRSAGWAPYSNWCVLQTFLKPHHYRGTAAFLTASAAAGLKPVCNRDLPEAKTELSYT